MAFTCNQYLRFQCYEKEWGRNIKSEGRSENFILRERSSKKFGAYFGSGNLCKGIMRKICNSYSLIAVKKA